MEGGLVMDTLYLVVPCYNEEEALPISASKLCEKLSALEEKGLVSPESRIVMVDDGSRDRTWEIISSLCAQAPDRFCGVKLSRNRGHQNALLAGLDYARSRSDMAISLDADLQDDIDAIDGFIEKYYEGCDIVYGVRSSRATDTAFKRGTAGLFYKLMTAMGADIVDNHADYRLMSRRALDSLFEFGEVNLFLRGIVPQIGYKTAKVFYVRNERVAGDSKYPLKKMLAFAFEGITSFSVRPIKLIWGAGAVIGALSALAMLVLAILLIWFSIPGLWFVALTILLSLGVELVALGIVGEYIGKIYLEAKRRPRFIVEETLPKEN